MIEEAPTGDRPSGDRRTNGLSAASWVPIGEVDPRQVGDLLSALADAGIAAYAVPSPGSRGGYLELRLPARPVSRLHVDAARRSDAEALVQAETRHDDPTPDAVPHEGAPLSTSDDEAFAAIVAGWDAPVTLPVAPWPVSEDTDPEPERPAPPAASRSHVVLPAAPAAPQPVPRPADDEEHYVAPPPPPVPRPSLRFALSLLAVAAGFAVLVGASLLSAGGQLPLVTGVLLVVGGITGLVTGMRDRDADDGWDDGAVV